MKLWSGRFTKQTQPLMDEFQASISFDHILWEYDIKGSIAHVEMLGKCEILSQEEVDEIIDGLNKVAEKLRSGEVEFKLEYEDIHMCVEQLLYEEIGDLAGKLHTARSRNDQTSLDLHLYVRDAISEMVRKLSRLMNVLLSKAEEEIDAILPGYTHLQRAQPVRFSHHLLAYASMFERDIERFRESYKRADLCPLGAGAIAGTSFPIDRHLVAQKLGFKRLYDNSMDAVSDRDYVLEFLSNSSIVMIHLSRLAEELILWSSQEFQFITLDDAYCTGSSMMPQKKNPDLPELIRGKSGRVVGHLMGLLTMLKGLPLTYNKDMQEDKEALFDTVSTLFSCLDLIIPLLETMKCNVDQMFQAADDPFIGATDLADYLTKKGLPFRQAHEVVGKIVLYCLEIEKGLCDLTLEELKEFHDLLEADVLEQLSTVAIVEARKSYGGTARAEVLEAIRRKKEWIGGNYF